MSWRTGGLLTATCVIAVGLALSSCDSSDDGGGGGGGTPWQSRDALKGAYLRVVANIGYTNGGDIAVSDSGIIYVLEHGGGTPPNYVHKIDADGTVTMDYVPGINAGSSGDIVCIGEDLILGGNSSSPTTAWFEKWAEPAGSLSALYSQTLGDYMDNFAVVSESTLYFCDNQNPGIYKATGAASSEMYLDMQADFLYADMATGDLYFSQNEQLYRRPAGNPPSVQWLYDFPLGTYVTDAVVDENGFVYVAVRTYSSTDARPYADGAVWKIAPDGSEGVALIDGFAAVDDMDYDRARGELVLFVNPLVLRARVDASDAAYHDDWMDMTPVVGSGLSSFADLATPVNRIAVTDDGTTYALDYGSPYVIHQATAGGTVTSSFITTNFNSTGDIIAMGNELLYGGSRTTPSFGTIFEHWASGSGSSIIFDQGLTYYYGFAAEAVDVTKLYFSARSGSADEIRKSVNGTTSTQYSAVATDLIFVHPDSNDLLYAVGPELRQILSVGSVDELVYRVPGANITDIAVDTDGAIYVTCTVRYMMSSPAAACASGAVWKILPDGSQGRAVVDATRYVQQAAIDPDASQEEIVLLGSTGLLFRTNVTTP